MLLHNTLNQAVKSSKLREMNSFNIKLMKPKTEGTASLLKPPIFGTQYGERDEGNRKTTAQLVSIASQYLWKR